MLKFLLDLIEMFFKAKSQKPNEVGTEEASEVIEKMDTTQIGFGFGLIKDVYLAEEACKAHYENKTCGGCKYYYIAIHEENPNACTRLHFDIDSFSDKNFSCKYWEVK
jgi:hypothetical protein